MLLNGFCSKWNYSQFSFMKYHVSVMCASSTSSILKNNITEITFCYMYSPGVGINIGPFIIKYLFPN